MGFSGMVEENGRGGRSLDWFSIMYYLSFYFIIIHVFKKVFLIAAGATVQLLNERIQLFVFLLCWLVPYYFLATFSAFVDIGMRQEGGGLHLSVIAALFLFMDMAVENLNQRRNAYENGNFDAVQFTNKKWFLIAATMIYFVVLHFNTSLGMNGLTERISSVVEWINSIQILSIILAIVSVIYVLRIIFYFAVLAISFGTIFGEFAESKQNHKVKN